MKRMGRKGFTLIEVLAVIAIIAILGIVSVPSALNAINNSKNASYNILLENIKTAGISLYEEVDLGNTVYSYNLDGTTSIKIEINNSSFEVNLQTLVNNGFLKGIANEDMDKESANNQNAMILLHSVTGEDIGGCKIKITKKVDSTTSNRITTYEIESASVSDGTSSSCPTTEELENGV